MVYRLNSIKAELDGDTIQYDNGESIWLVSYLAMYDWDIQHLIVLKMLLR